MISNKTILLLTDQIWAWPMCLLGEELKKNNNVHYYFTNPEYIQGKNPTKTHIDFYLSDKVKKENIHDLKDINEKFFENKNNITLDQNRLNELEQNYTNFSTINKQLLSSQLTSSHFHDRFYYELMTNEERLYWLILNYDKTESLIELIKPDFIFDIETAELQKSIINEIAYKKKITSINIEYTRYKNFIVPTFSLGLKLDNYFLETYQRNKEQKDKDHKKYINEVITYRNQNSIVSERNKKYVFSSYQFNLIELLKKVIRKSYNFSVSTFRSGSLPTLQTIKKVLWHYTVYFRKFYLYSKFNKYFKIPTNEQYIYMPLHYIPESTTFTKAPMYINELMIIEAISKTMPINWKLYVKEHPMMVGEREISFYSKVAKIPNVKLLDFKNHREPKDLIQKSKAVITITGSSAFEASILNKPAIVFGSAAYNVISGIKVANSFEDLEHLFKLIKTNNWPQDNTMDCATYLRTIDEVGVDLDIEIIIKLSEKKIKLQSLDDSEKLELKNMINSLILFYEKAINISKNEQYKKE